MVPEIKVQELAAKIKSPESFIILDVRENWETNLVKLSDARVFCLPLSRIARERQAAFPEPLQNPQAEIVVLCHHGVRSADVTGWMLQNGWHNVSSLAGGIAEYAAQVDASVGFY